MIEIKNLTKTFGRKQALKNISFTVKKGEVLGFLGPNGAGKSTTMNIITGYLSMTSGSVKVNGYDILENPDEAKKSIGYLPELPPIYMDMTVEEFLRFVCDLKNVDKKSRSEHIEGILKQVGLDEVYDRLIGNLSKGYRQRVGLAQALIGDPEILILDEPTVGLDPNQIIEIRKLIRRLSKDHTIILSSHILTEVQAVCDRVVIINKGKIVASEYLSDLGQRLSGSRKLLLAFKGDPNLVSSSLKKLNGVNSVVVKPHSGDNEYYEAEIISDPSINLRIAVFRHMVKINCDIIEFRSLDPTLEDIFLSITG